MRLKRRAASVDEMFERESGNEEASLADDEEKETFDDDDETTSSTVNTRGFSSKVLFILLSKFKAGGAKGKNYYIGKN